MSVGRLFAGSDKSRVLPGAFEVERKSTRSRGRNFQLRIEKLAVIR